MQYDGCIFTTLHDLTGLPQPTRQFMYKRLMGMFHRKLRPSFEQSERAEALYSKTLVSTQFKRSKNFLQALPSGKSANS